ncbi:MAG: GNAT family N-acetyltransferase [Bacteroidales bacterium]
MDNLDIKIQAYRLWKECFGDDDDFIHRYLDYAFVNNLFFYSEKNKSLVSFLSLIPVKLFSDNKELQGYYLYGVATSPEFRGEGAGKRLLEKALHSLSFDFIVTIPASDSLFKYYRNQGFTYFLKRGVRACLFPEMNEIQSPVEEIFPDDPQILFAKEGMKNNRNGFRWGYAHYLYLFGEYERDNAEIRFFKTADKDVNYLVLKIEKSHCTVLDSDMEPDEVMNALALSGMDRDMQVRFFEATEDGGNYASVRFSVNTPHMDLSSASLTLALD